MFQNIKNYIKYWRISGEDYPIWAGEVALLFLLHLLMIMCLMIMIKFILIVLFL